MALISTKCTNCGADLQLDDSREYAFCQYCGNKMLMASIIKTENTTVIRDEAAIMRAENEAKQAEINEANRKKREKIKRAKLICKIAIPVAILLFLGIVYLISYTKYGLVKSSSFAGRAFNVTKEQLLTDFLNKDEQSESTYGLKHTKWIEDNDVEKYITETYKKVYNGEKKFHCNFYYPEHDDREELPRGTVYYSIIVLTDSEDKIVKCTLKIPFIDKTTLEKKTLNGYYGVTLPCELFSALTGKNESEINKSLKNASETGLFKKWNEEADGDVRYKTPYDSNSDYKEFIVEIAWDSKFWDFKWLKIF